MEYFMNLTAYIPLLFMGTGTTVLAWIYAGSLSMLIGTILGIASCKHLTRPHVLFCIRWYTFIAKGIPAYVQILIAYFVIPSLLGLNVSGLVAAIGALAFCSSGYITEIIRAGINSIAPGQWDACLVLGYPLQATLIRIIMPQTMKTILPALFGEFEQLLKSTSLLATIGVTELTRTGINIISRELNPLPVYLTIAGIYLLLSAILHIITMHTERRLSYGIR
jgi:His/Glu/Gln/Arg/opine family amino acid ABC transporter permease subunit